jgi:hypothetical protein
MHATRTTAHAAVRGDIQSLEPRHGWEICERGEGVVLQAQTSEFRQGAESFGNDREPVSIQVEPETPHVQHAFNVPHSTCCFPRECTPARTPTPKPCTKPQTADRKPQTANPQPRSVHQLVAGSGVVSAQRCDGLIVLFSFPAQSGGHPEVNGRQLEIQYKD